LNLNLFDQDIFLLTVSVGPHHVRRVGRLSFAVLLTHLPVVLTCLPVVLTYLPVVLTCLPVVLTCRAHQPEIPFTSEGT